MKTKMTFALRFAVATGLFVGGCASAPPTTTSGEARKALEDKYTPMIGSARKSDFVTEFGNAAWCKPKDTGAETCRFYKKIMTKWTGDKKDRKSYEMFDQIVAEFDPNGQLRSFETDAQR